tara:strand:- start:7096 stop:7764 length:669 start_codon:yes stop_codon:yes gene_type:complete
MARHKTIESSDENRTELYDKYIRPNHRLVRATVSMLTKKKTEVDDNFQRMCYTLLRNVDTYSPEYKISTWIITCCRREVGKFEANKESYVDAKKGTEFEYQTEHHGYKKKYRKKSIKDFVNVYDDSTFKSNPNEMIHNGVGERLIEILRLISPHTDFGVGNYKDILDGIMESGDMDIAIHFMKKYHNEKVKDIAFNLGIEEREVKNALSRAKTRIDNILNNL